MLDRRQGAAELRNLAFGKQSPPCEVKLRVEAGIAVADRDRGERPGGEKAQDDQGRCGGASQRAQEGVRDTAWLATIVPSGS